MKPQSIQGSELRVGDTIETWWTPRRDTITAIEPYTGPLASLWGGRARVAIFALHNGGMTIAPDEPFTLISRAASIPADIRA